MKAVRVFDGLPAESEQATRMSSEGAVVLQFGRDGRARHSKWIPT
jgi:hypothetical protein